MDGAEDDREKGLWVWATVQIGWFKFNVQRSTLFNCESREVRVTRSHDRRIDIQYSLDSFIFLSRRD